MQTDTHKHQSSIYRKPIGVICTKRQGMQNEELEVSMMTVLYRYLVSMVVAALWTVVEELVSSFVNYGPITNSTYGVIAPMFVVLMPVLANAFSVPFARDFIHLGRMRLPTLRDFFVFLRVSILAYILFFASNFCFRSMNDNPFPSLRWFLWLLILVCFSVLAFGASGLAFLCGFRDRSALRCFSRALTIYKNNFLNNWHQHFGFSVLGSSLLFHKIAQSRKMVRFRK